MGVKFKNNAVSVLTGSLPTFSTDILINSADDGKFPVIAAIGADYFYVTLEDKDHNIEIVKVVRHVVGSNNLETDGTADSGVNRGQDGTLARPWAIGDVVELRVTAKTLEDVIATADNHIADPTDAHVASAISYAGASGLSATNVESALDELDAEKAPLASVIMDGDTAGGVLSGSYPNPLFASGVSTFPAGTRMLFQQTAAPVGWSKDTSHDNKALRIVAGTASNGGSSAFTAVFGGGKATGGHLLTAAESGLPAHSHTVYFNSGGALGPEAVNSAENAYSGNANRSTSVNGGTNASSAHDHTLSLDLAYVDAIICSKD